MAQRIELGFAATNCKCSACTNNCKRLSGVCIPEDLARWHDEHGDGFLAWALEHLAASPGSIVMYKGTVYRIPTLVPRRGPDGRGRCHWLNDQDLCDVYTTSPFGCSHFDCSMGRKEADPRSTKAHVSIMRDLAENGPCTRLWHELHARGQIVEPPELVREKLNRETK